MQRKFITNLAFLLLLNILVKPFWLLGIDRAVQNEVGAVLYGQYYALFNFSFLLNILLDLGITNFNNRNIAQNKQLLNKHLSGIITLRILLAFGFIIISTLFGYAIGYGMAEFKILWILLFNQILASFILYLRSNISGLLLFKTDSIISVLDRFIMIAICSVLLWGNITSQPFNILWFIYAQTAAYIITIVTAFMIVAGRANFSRLGWDKLFFLMILKKSYPFALLILLMSFYNRIDSVMLERLLENGKEQAGIYAQAFRLLDASNMIAFLFAGLLLPLFSRMIKYGERISDLLRLSYSLLGAFSISVGVISVFFGNEIMALLYNEHTDISSGVFRLLMVCFFAISTTYVYGTLLTANNNLKYLNIMAAGAMILNVTLNFILIPKYQVMGAAIASLVTQYAAAFTQVILGHRIFNIKVEIAVVLRFIIFTLASILFCYLIKKMIPEFYMSIAVSAVFMLTASVLTGLFSVKSILLILKSDNYT
jgi:O-antigen/teichoic acid export membrane protein